jgi:hypothetical protein
LLLSRNGVTMGWTPALQVTVSEFSATAASTNLLGGIFRSRNEASTILLSLESGTPRAHVSLLLGSAPF